MATRPETSLLFGRDDELGHLRSLASGVADGTGSAVLIQGEPGIGRSTLLTAGADAAGFDSQVIRGACDEVGPRFPGQALLGCLRQLGDCPATATVESLTTVVERRCARSPLVLVLDDLQWADEVSLRAWRQLCRMSQRMPLLLVAACRPVPRRPGLSLLGEDVAAGVVTAIRLGRLPQHEATNLVMALLGAGPGPRLRRLVELAGGNPRFVRDIVAALGPREQVVDGPEGAQVDVDWDADQPLPVQLAAVVMDRLGFLSDETIHMLRMAALLGAVSSMSDLEAAAGTVAAGLEEACAAGVLAASFGWVTFRHRLVQKALYESTPASLRSALHRQVAEALASSTGPVECVATHLLAAADALDGWALSWTAAAGAELTRREPRMSVTLHLRALDRLPVDDIRRDQTEVSLATAWLRLGGFDGLERLARQALARRCGAEHAARMTWLRAMALMHSRPSDGLSLTENPIPGVDLGDRWRARLGALHALMLGAAGRLDEVGPAAERALAAARRTGDGVAAGYALYAMAAEASGCDLRRTMALTEQALAATGDDPEAADLRLTLLRDQTRSYDYLGLRTAADAALCDALALASRVSTFRHAGVQLHAATHWYEVGSWRAALTALNAVDDVPEQGELPVRWHGLCALLAAHRDDRDTVRRHLAELDGKAPPTEVVRRHGQHLAMARALAAEREGRPARALEMLARQFEPERRPEAHGGYHYRMADMVRLALAADNRAFAGAVLEAAVADARRQPDSPRLAAVADWCRGLLGADPTLLLASAEYFRSANESFDLAAALEDAADVHGERGQVAAAKAAFADSVATYTELGAAWHIRRAERRVRPYGIGRGQRGPRRRPAFGWSALTPAELKVARLVVEGRSNPEIAAELLLSRRTVQSHVSHILAKLGARSRTEIAREARHAGVADGLAS